MYAAAAHEVRPLTGPPFWGYTEDTTKEVHTVFAFNHFNFNVLDLERSLRFYEEALGLIEGTAVTCLGQSPLGDPSAYAVRGAAVALRRADSRTIEVEA